MGPDIGCSVVNNGLSACPKKQVDVPVSLCTLKMLLTEARNENEARLSRKARLGPSTDRVWVSPANTTYRYPVRMNSLSLSRV